MPSTSTTAHVAASASCLALTLCAAAAFSQEPAAPVPTAQAPTAPAASAPPPATTPGPSAPVSAAPPTATVPVPSTAPEQPTRAEVIELESPPAEVELPARDGTERSAAESTAVPQPPAAEPIVSDEEPLIVESEAPSAFRIFLFADANYAVTTSHRASVPASHRAFAGIGADGTIANGFALEWAGLDVSYDGGEVAATANLRYGDGVIQYFGDRGPSGIANLTQAYVTWMPHERIALDLGQFGTIFGAEVAESWHNLNYTRGGLYFLMQPFFHTGLRGAFRLSDVFGVNAMVVNGVNSTVDEDDAPSVAVQAAITPLDNLELYVGGLQTIDSEADSSPFDTFLDLVALLRLGDFTGILNADYNIARDIETGNGEVADGAFFGVSAAAGYAFSHLFGAALRYEFLSDPDNILYGVHPDGTSVNTVTGTIDLKPLKDRDNLVIRWDNRFEFASQDIYNDTTNLPTETWFMSVLGVVVKMNE